MRAPTRQLLAGSLVLSLGVGLNATVAAYVLAIVRVPSVIDTPSRVLIPFSTVREADPAVLTERAAADIRQFPVFSGVATEIAARGIYEGIVVPLSLAGRSEMSTAAVSSNYFEVLGITPFGRDFGSEAGALDLPPVIISDHLARSLFGSATAAIGAAIETLPQSVRVIGVAPPSFRGALKGEAFDVWIRREDVQRFWRDRPMSGDPKAWAVVALCRLTPTVSVADAEAWFHSSPREPLSATRLVPLPNVYSAPGDPTRVVEPGTLLLFAGFISASILVGASVVLAAMMRLHFAARQRELAIRMLLGASRRAIALQIARDIAAVVALGSVGAILSTAAGLRVAPRIVLPGGIDVGRLDVSVSPGVIAMALLFCAVAALGSIVGLWRQLGSPDAGLQIAKGLTLAARGSSIRARQLALGAHVAVSIAVVASTMTLVATVTKAANQLPGFDADKTVFVTVQNGFRFQLEPDDGRGVSAARALLERAAVVPGVERIALGPAPIRIDEGGRFPKEQKLEISTGPESLALGFLSVGEGYFETLGVPLMLGSGGRRGEAVVTPGLVDALWPDQSSIGQVVRFVDKTLEVKGVADIPFGSLRWGRMPVLIAFDADADLNETMRVLKRVSFVARTSDADATKVALRRLASDLFPNAASIRVERGADLVAAQLGNERLGAFFFSGFSVVAIGLALVGTIGLVAQTLRTHERDLAIRAALGAGRLDLVKATAAPTLLPVVLGGVGGFVVSFWSSALIRGVILNLIPDRSFEAAVAIAGTALMASLVIVAGALAIRHPLRRPFVILKGDVL